MKTYAGEGTLAEFSRIVKQAISEAGGGTGDTSYLVRAPVGTIVIWSGTADNIPTGWQLCDGTNGTPDLQDKFVLGAGTAHAVGETGGAEEVTLTVAQMPSHNHTAYVAENISSSGDRLFGIERASPNTRFPVGSTGGSQPHPNMPPYYTLCYIMKLTADATDGVSHAEFTEALEGKQDKLENGDGTTVAGNKVNVTTPVQGIYTQAEYDALPEEQKNKGMYVIPDAGGVAGGGSSGEIYSTEETRIGTWIDGKPLYRRVIEFTSGPSINAWGLFGDASNIETLALIRGVLDNGFPVCIPDVVSSMSMKDGQFGIFSTVSYYLNCPGICIVEYTKTTDPTPTAAAFHLTSAPAVAQEFADVQSIASAAATASSTANIDLKE